MNAPILELRNVAKSFGRVHALRGIDFEVRPGEVIGLLGDNGAGKTTLIKVLVGVHRPNSGKIYCDGEPITLGSPRDAMARGISVVYQDLGIIPLLAVWRNFFLGREERASSRLPFHYRLKAREMQKVARQALHDLGIEIDDVELTVAKLSGGEKQSIAIARAVYFENRVLILDEPTAALSLKETAKVLSYIDQARRKGVAVVFITHNISQALEVCDRYTVLFHGAVAETVHRGDVTEDELASLINTGTREMQRIGI